MLVLALALSCCAQTALAQANEPPAGYAELIDDALHEYEALHFEEARALFGKAHVLYPNARTLRGLGMVEFELRHYTESADYLQQALASSLRPLTGSLRDSTTALLGRARGFVGELTLSVQPSSALVRVDGVAAVPDISKPIALNVGDHVIEASAHGYLGQQRKIAIRGGERQQLQLELTAEPTAAQTPPAATTPSDREPARDAGPGALPWVLVSVGGAMMIGGGVLLAIAQSDISQVEDASRGTAWSQSADAYDASPLESGLGFALLGVGAAGVASGLLWGLQGSSEEHADTGKLRLALGARNIAVLGSF